ncbi:MAG TPA: nuclear transport factor 2 family protein [Amycolatopsis sp.]|uniref:nuclear transport factor 2 family protein n=1 Tax=Amycolatopsis sp. TaxID=37632 RepID=UPI002B459C5A|nr:nuclear transport factor 2 family protein [Amycolatopsis sp.]HJQ48787.1 nuclear transport factor 2 family protein [Amycolatopsis sp.]HKS50211.1 nuclear transport factor 2 family protein [Amycolatopsis sp.]
MADSLDAYVSAWAEHTKLRGADADSKLQAVLAMMAEDIEYTDTPSGHTFKGHDAVGHAFKHAISEVLDLTVKPIVWYTDGKRFTIEYETTIKSEGKELVAPTVAVGTIGPDGKITSHSDYYDRRALGL